MMLDGKKFRQAILILATELDKKPHEVKTMIFKSMRTLQGKHISRQQFSQWIRGVSPVPFHNAVRMRKVFRFKSIEDILKTK